jgi:hypothetical protein
MFGFVKRLRSVGHSRHKTQPIVCSAIAENDKVDMLCSAILSHPFIAQLPHYSYYEKIHTCINETIMQIQDSIYNINSSEIRTIVYEFLYKKISSAADFPSFMHPLRECFIKEIEAKLDSLFPVSLASNMQVIDNHLEIEYNLLTRLQHAINPAKHSEIILLDWLRNQPNLGGSQWEVSYSYSYDNLINYIRCTIAPSRYIAEKVAALYSQNSLYGFPGFCNAMLSGHSIFGDEDNIVSSIKVGENSGITIKTVVPLVYRDPRTGDKTIFAVRQFTYAIEYFNNGMIKHFDINIQIKIADNNFAAKYFLQFKSILEAEDRDWKKISMAVNNQFNQEFSSANLQLALCH